MKRIFLNKLFLVSSGVLLFCYAIIYACGGGDDYDYFSYNSNFTPETFADKSYAPLFLSSDVFYRIGSDTQHNSRFNEQIIKEWSDYLKGKVDAATVSYFMIGEVNNNYNSGENNEATNFTDVAQLHVYYKNKKENKPSLKWGKKISLKDPKIKSFIEFLYLAQKIETVSVVEENWSYEPVVAKTFDDLKMIQSIENVYNTTADSFLKNRYWFLTMKGYFYSSNKQKAIDFFNKTEKSVAKNQLYYRALAYVAGVYYKAKKYATSNYLYAQVFDKCPEMRVVTAYSFSPKSEKDWNQSLVMAKNNKEKAALWAVHGYYKDEKQAVEKIYQLDPKSEHLNYLLTRLINRQEQLINNSFTESKNNDTNTPARNQTVTENKTENRAKIDKSEIDLVAAIAAAGNTQKPYMWDVALGYLQTLKGDYDKADTNFSKAEKTMPKTQLATYQLRLLRFVNNLSKIDKLTSKNEKTVLADLNWLYLELPKTYKGDDFRYQNAAAWSKAYLASLYREQQNPVMAELFGESRGYYWNSGNSFYDNEKNLLDMKAFLAKPNKTEIEKVGADIYSYKLKDINSFQAVQATFNNKVPEAIEFIKQTDSIQYAVFLGNPFNGSIKDCHDCDHVAPQKKKYTIIDFLTTVKTMQDKVAQKEDLFTNNILLGNAFYNITHFGNGRIFYETNIVGYGSSPYSFRDSMKKMITNCSVSKMYYKKALEAATTKEQKAKCIYFIAKCERNDYYNQKYNSVNNWWDVEDDKINFIAFDAFKTLKNDYSDTRYYQDVIAECGYFNTYVNQ
ncbi:hypothetical protein SGQ44_00885 [Flavobacterium sp. Fl-77]|uniref:Tetratricopeptide repeat protein n=1 Tax=Flavobacterium flavipigmentatum TaxID=2893884 RepID=A0AAJ2VVN8_9FLAO|nr:MULTISPECIES: hypothetical protein [unclassified Flavobacterium]MDX6180688.1 hypothetical protein [Flavobacterium sp. Fl-33]MDX6184288.1 hypothetical protein [Flavobacterium sp. Fl-77]UFH39399.1 hypothetical protein LNP22_03785 [Flavobacterium sp. F-70]